jgi:hypothetical protein
MRGAGCVGEGGEGVGGGGAVGGFSWGGEEGGGGGGGGGGWGGSSDRTLRQEICARPTRTCGRHSTVRWKKAMNGGKKRKSKRK